MTNTDIITLEKTEAMQQMYEAIQTGDKDALAKSWNAFCNNIQQQVIKENEEYLKLQQSGADAAILASRGIRQLTSEETAYYQKVIDAMKSSTPRQTLENLDVVMPITTIDNVFEDIVVEHPLLDMINFQNANGLIEILMNTHETQLATWSALCAEIVTEITSGFKKITMSQNKLSAFLPICKAMLDLGPVWLDRYIRIILRDAIASGLEEGIINGAGTIGDLHEPIGMVRDLDGSVSTTDGYPKKSPVPLNALSPAAFGAILAGLARTAKGNPRRVTSVLMIVNPVDYLTKIFPATTVMGANGTYVNDVFPFPTRVVQSIFVNEGEAIIGIPKRYFMAIGTGKEGRIEYSDEYRFLEDERVYLIKLYGYGQPLDNNSFILLDISGMQPASISVRVSNPDEFPGGVNEGANAGG